MRATRFAIATVAVNFLLGGCADLKDSVAKFDQSAHAAAAAEMDFLQSALTLKCASDYYSSATLYAATGSGAVPDYKVRCAVKRVDELRLRQLAMDSLSAYADRMLALAGGSDKGALDTDSQSMAESLNAAARTEKFSNIPAASIVEAGIIALTELTLDKTKIKDLRQAAAEAQPSLADLVADLKSENDTSLKNIPANTTAIYSAIDTTIMSANRRPSALDFAAAAYILQSSGIPDGGMTRLVVDPTQRVEQLNACLDAVLAANKALAAGTATGIRDAVKDLVQRVQATRTMRTTLNN